MTTTRFAAPKSNSYDVVIVGGAVMGSSTAYWLSENADFGGRVLVVERDSTYHFAPSARAASCIRQQFSQPVNILISQFGVEFIRGFGDRMQKHHPNATAPDLAFKEHGFLYCWRPEHAEKARARAELQRSLGAHTLFLTPGEIKERFPWANVDDLGGASWATEAEGWFDNIGLLNGLRHAAKAQGVEYVDNEVTGVDRDGDRITGVQLATGEKIACGTLVNTAGGRGRIIANLAGFDIPIERRKRDLFVVASDKPVSGRMPHVIDISGAFCRPEGQFFLTGHSPPEDPEAALDDYEARHWDFEEYLWPALINRIPQFDALKVQRFWTCHYDYNTLDYNAIIGPHSEVKNFIFCNGFSGHGLQQSPAVGRAISELIAYGAYRTLDLSEMGFERVAAKRPFLEEAII
ncbi:MAG TPA: FAD-dependent oxidoreductase [Aestuariivirga sp.]|nr:FAD-dependent oxidoreductase [Aestuariivirga sp.]